MLVEKVLCNATGWLNYQKQLTTSLAMAEFYLLKVKPRFKQLFTVFLKSLQTTEVCCFILK